MIILMLYRNLFYIIFSVLNTNISIFENLCYMFGTNAVYEIKRS